MASNKIKSKESISRVEYKWLSFKWQIIILLFFIVYYKVFFLKFTNKDDVVFIVMQHDYLSDWSNFWDLFKHSVFQKHDGFYRPVLLAYFMLMNHLAESDNFLLHHLPLLVLHIVNVVLVNSFFVKFVPDRERRFWLVLFFAIHPVLTMAIAWIPGVNDLLLTFFCLLYFKVLDKIFGLKAGSQFLNFILLFIFSFFALFTKETALFLPLASVLIFFFNGTWANDKKKLLFVSFIWLFIGTVWFFLRRDALISSQAEGLSANNFYDYFTRSFGFWAYLSKAILPIDLCTWPLLNSVDIIETFCTIIVFSILVFFNKKRNNKLFLLGFGWFTIFLIPVFFTTTTNFVLLEHRLYLPLIGFLLMLNETVIFSTGLIKDSVKRSLLIILTIFLGFQGMRYLPTFTNPLTFNKSGVTHSPNNAYLNNCYGIALSDSNRIAEAIPYFHKAFKLDSSIKNVRLFIARFDLIPNKKYDSAKIFLLQEIIKTPFNSDNYFALATVGFETKDYLFCEKYLEKYIQLRPDNIEIQQFIISIYFQNRHFVKANELAKSLKAKKYRLDENLLHLIQDSLISMNKRIVK